MENDKLKLRVEPIQLRAKETVDLILENAAQLLEEVGLDGLTTKGIAERADIRVRNIYRYFENKQAIICALAQRMAEEQTRFINDFEYLAAADIEWKNAVNMSIDAFVFGFAFQAGMLAIRKAMQSTPELRAIDEEQNKELAQKLAAALRKRGVTIEEARMSSFCLVVLEVTTGLLDRACLEYTQSQDMPKALEIIKELKEILCSYLAPYIRA